ncbi:malate synthase G [Vibrio ishigakensis]|uniref:Malate synthase G n=1 Tax=Vibrio ishigakensis TaxID=1481914 RepID=A0A0B8P289_9VIBR|nr:malate synthase G [Vibrio ishigakensis]
MLAEFAPRNQELLSKRDYLQSQIDEFHKTHRSFTTQQYQEFLTDIGYLLPEGEDFTIETQNLDQEITSMAAPQLVVPIKNARFALNAANARWGSLYDALYGSDVIPSTHGMQAGKKYNPARGKRVIEFAKTMLDEVFPLDEVLTTT